ncbi:hypothetical protein FPK09_14020 [Mycobacterium tuberculosis]|nr:hypothetical protein FPK09_14020 [Mycobacterium tuberculosis]QOM40016.1 hypothetical protein FPK08_14030 [Mycobacterium tuberculosis]
MVRPLLWAFAHRQIGPVEQDGRQVVAGHPLQRVLAVLRVPAGGGLVITQRSGSRVGLQMGEAVAVRGSGDDLVGV